MIEHINALSILHDFDIRLHNVNELINILRRKHPMKSNVNNTMRKINILINGKGVIDINPADYCMANQNRKISFIDFENPYITTVIHDSDDGFILSTWADFAESNSMVD